MLFKLLPFFLVFIFQAVHAAPMTQEDHKACRDGVTGMVFFKFKSSLSDTARRRLENEVAQGKRDKSTIHPFANIEKIDCQSIISEHAEIYQKFSSKYSACLYANTLEQFTSIYADDNLDPKIELRKQINDKVYSTFSFERCPSARSSMEGTLYKLRDAKTGLELCETSAVGLQEIGIIFRDQCRQ